MTRKKRLGVGANATRITITLPAHLVERADEAAMQDYTTRSNIIRTALLWYLRPQGRDLDKLDPDTIYDMLRRRKAVAAGRKLASDINDFFNL